jgi:hypothetical protein
MLETSFDVIVKIQAADRPIGYFSPAKTNRFTTAVELFGTSTLRFDESLHAPWA